MGVAVGIFAHQEERRIGACLASLPLDRGDTVFHVLVNGSTDKTAARAREAAGGRTNVVVHELAEGGKARTWNHFVHELLDGGEAMIVFMDGDAEIVAGSIDALAADLAARPDAHAAAGMPVNGRSVEHYRRSLREERGLFGDLYALSGRFVAAIRARGLRLPEDLVGDDGLVAAWAHTDLGRDADWERERVLACEEAGFRCEPVSLWRPSTLRMQYRRMTNYSVRFFQNRIISDIMASEGVSGLPGRMDALYGAWLPRFRSRPLPTGWFDRKALAKMREAWTRGKR
ncbi:MULTISPECIES: glycosyltransferase [Sphingobium]|uniref:Family 2 glycosyl transferase n=1 Tax=Sphingobium chungbukense TaxID=56193 RepID=A0A0M3AIA1_9SPHN|nr:MULTISPECIES: glycosyltransferase family A protein [Sphingobium]KKW89580.1 family 2 glycosyl transferase [Sphingobium chungbukense]PJG49238.1 family 2 glycosyl transferase [Sphingobium sp. LB126]